LGIPYDREVHAGKPQAPAPSNETADKPAERLNNDGELFAGINDLPKDDPLRAAAEVHANAPQPAGIANPDAAKSSVSPPADSQMQAADATPSQPPTIPAGMVAAPQLVGKPLRAAMETLMADGLRLQAEGSGVARSQSPASGTPMAPGAVVLVRFSR
jgi:cell division protein FtsI (penicillin-binding protein 3)